MEKEAMAYYKKAVNNAECYFQLTSESRCIEHIILINERMEKIYASRGNYKQVYACAENSIHYAEIYMKRFPSSYSRLLYAEVLCRMADARANIGKISNVEQELIKCLKMSEFASNIFKSRYRQLTYNIYNAFATNFYKQKMYKEALNAVNKSIKLLPNEIQAYHRKLDILKAVGEKEEAKNVDRILKQIEGNI
jgi:tetratricopeptide (TPR) repeat protein